MNKTTWVVDSEDNLIHVTDERRTIICHMSGTMKNPEVYDQARQISAVPEMLTALKACARFFRNGPESAEEHEICESLNIALKKANGES